MFREQGPFDAILSDLGMPGINGFELARMIKKISPKTLIVLMIGWSAELDPKKIRESGIDRAINKPFDVDQVLQLMQEAMAIREQM